MQEDKKKLKELQAKYGKALEDNENLAEVSTQYIYAIYLWFKYDVGQRYYTSQVRPDRGLNS